MPPVLIVIVKFAHVKCSSRSVKVGLRTFCPCSSSPVIIDVHTAADGADYENTLSLSRGRTRMT